MQDKKTVAWVIRDPQGNLDISLWRTRIWAARWARVIGGRYWHKQGYQLIRIDVKKPQYLNLVLPSSLDEIEQHNKPH
ncbi:MAG: hypothetical protein KGQ58_03825 [Proteobacteria bacterium]|nr:hypothetical protein [Pseudomonadota bacterium]